MSLHQGRGNQRKNNKRKRGRKKSNKPCKHFNSPAGCRFGDRCWFSHASGAENSSIDSNWWRKGEAPAPKILETRVYPKMEDVTGSFAQQLITLVNMPRRTRQKIHSIACRVAILVRSFVPLATFHREVSLTPLLGNLHNWPLLALSVCPVTSKVYVAGQSTPIFVIDPQDDPKPRWLCGASWPENGLPTLGGGFNSALITSVKVTRTGLVLFTIDCKAPLLSERPIEADPRGIYAIRGDKPTRLQFFHEDKPFRFDNIKEIALSEGGDRMYVLASKRFILEFEFDESDLGACFRLVRKLDIGVKATAMIVVHERKLLLLGEKDIVILHSETFAIQRLPLKLHLLSLCKMKDSCADCILIHSDQHIRAVSNETFLESLKDGHLKERLQLETTALHKKNIVIDLPLLGYDQRKQQIITDTDSRVLTWLDVF